MNQVNKNLKFYSFSIFFLLISFCAYAQPKAVKEADRLFNEGNYSEALEAYKKASTKIKNKSLKAEVAYKQALCYKNFNDTKRAEVAFAKAIKSKYTDPQAILDLADMMRANEKYDEALTEYENYKKLKPGDPRGNIGAESSKLAVEWKKNPTKHQVNNVQAINTKWDEFSPSFAKKGYKEIIFSSSREGSKGSKDGATGQLFTDVYEAAIDKNGKWSTPSNLPDAVNSKANEGSMVFNTKYNAAFFTRCPDESKKIKGCQIYFAKKKGNNYDEPELLEFAADSFTVGHPALSNNELILIFSSDMPGGMGGKDLWYTNFDKKRKTWGVAINLGTSINTEGDEMFPVFRNDSTLYFSSNGHIGMGSLDIYEAKKVNGKWGNISNLKFPINSAGDDFGIIFQDKIEKGYFTSNRAGGKGGDDIYDFSVPPILFSLRGIVFDFDTQNPIAGATVKMTNEKGEEIQATTDQTGAYYFDNAKFKQDNTYDLVASSKEFLNDIGKESTQGETVGKDYKRDFYLKTTKKGPIKLPEILYDLNSAQLRPESKDSLNGLIQTLKDNPNIRVELMSHTDSRGTAKSNIDLSQRRAQSVVDYLIELKIDPNRLQAKGYGETKLLNKCKDNAPCTEVEHQINRRTEFKIVATDFAPKEGSVEFKKPVIKTVDEDEEVETDVKQEQKTNIQIDQIQNQEKPKEEPKAPEAPKKVETPKSTNNPK